MVFTYQIFCSAETVSQCSRALYHRRYRKDSIMTSAKSKKHFDGCVAVYSHNSKFTKNLTLKNTSAAYEFVSRCAFNIFNVYEKLGKSDKKSCKSELKKAKKDIIKNKAFGNKALKMRCYGKVFWFIYKVFEKTVGRLLKGTK